MELDLDAEWRAERDALVLALHGQCFRVGTDGLCSLVRPFSLEERETHSVEAMLPQLAPYLRAIAAKARALGNRCHETISRLAGDGRVEIVLHAVPLPDGTVVVAAQPVVSKQSTFEVSTLIHDLTNPLTYVLASLGLLREALTEHSLERHPDVAELLEALDDGIGRIHSVVRGLSNRSQSSPPDGQHVGQAAPRARVPHDATSIARVLVVDDEPQLLESLARLLAPHEVDTASSGLEALDLLTHGPLPDVIFCDVMMPGMDGLELVSRIIARWPALAGRVVFITGGIADPLIAQRLADLAFPVLEKPLRDGPLREHIARLIESKRDQAAAGHPLKSNDDSGSQVA